MNVTFWLNVWTGLMLVIVLVCEVIQARRR
jgi:hypothetical protein